MAALAKAHVRGVSHPPLLEETIPEALARVIAAHGERDCLIVRSQGVRWSYREFHDAVRRFAAGLLALGLEPGERVGIWAPNRAEWVVAQFATAEAGLILVNINPAYRRSELEYALNKVGARALITAARFKSSDYLAMIADLAPEIAEAAPGELRAQRLPELRMVIALDETELKGAHSYGAVMALGAGEAARTRLAAVTPRLDPDDAINIQFTSGTTGAPKGATLSHRGVLNNGFFVGRAMALGPEDRLCVPVPLYHCFGMVLSVLACVSHGAAMIFPGEGFEPVATLEAIAEERASGVHGVPTMFIAMLDHPEFSRFDLSSLRTGIMAGSPCPIEIMKRAVAEMGVREITIAYGMTETSPVSFQTSVDDPLERRVSTVGRIHPHVEVRIVDEAGDVCAPGVAGELQTRGYSVMKGYWGDRERSAEAIRDGWMLTGDLAVIDDEGYCNIVGRLKDMIIRGGENIYPREIEEFLYCSPEIQDVQVFGVPDPKYGEAVCAWVTPKPGAAPSPASIRAFCEGEIAHYKIPAHIRIVEAFPQTVTGKAQKFVMRAAMIEELGLDEAETA